MAVTEHKDIQQDGIHIIHRYSVQNQTALDALVPLAEDLHKLILKLDDGVYYRISSVSPYTYQKTTITINEQTLIDSIPNKQDVSEKGQINGYASLDGNGHVPSAQLPSYVDDVLEFPTVNDFPATGETGKIYVALDTGYTYRWSGTMYILLNSTTALWGGISGNLADQTDLQTELDKIPTLNGVNHGIVHQGAGELITINADPSKFDLQAFDYYINGVKYSYAGATGLSTGFVAGDDFLIIGVDENGLVLNPKDTFFTPTDLQTKLEVGGMATADGTNIIAIGNSHFNSDEFIRNLYVWSKFGKKTNFLGTAGAISESATPLQIDIAGGSLIDPDLNKEDITGASNIGMVAYYHISGAWELQPKVTPFVIDNLQYDNGTDLVTLGNNKWASHTIARSSRTGTVYFIYSQAEYASEGTAIDAPYSLGGFGEELGNEVEPLAKIIIQKSASNINQVIDIRNLTTSVVSASTSTMQTTYDRSTQPQIVIVNGKPIEYRNSLGDADEVIQTWKSNDGTNTYMQVGKTANTHTLGWRDLVAPFGAASAGGAAPTLVTLANGVRLNRFNVGDSMHVSYHVDHDYALGTGAYHHVHWFPETAMADGENVVWRIFYIVAKGHHQGESLTGARTSFDVTYTSSGVTVAGDHIVSEASDLQAYDLKEADTVVLAEIQLLSKTYAGNVIGIQADLHYQSDREWTIGKRPDFNVPD